MAANQIAVAFLIAHYKVMVACFLKANHFFTDIFKAGQHIQHFSTASFCNIGPQFGSHDGFDNNRFIVQLFLAQHIIHQQSTGLVTGQ